MLEWLKRHVWKACGRLKRLQGSNPCLSAQCNNFSGAALSAAFVVVGLRFESPALAAQTYYNK